MVLRGKSKEEIMDEEGVLRIKGRVCVPRVDDLIQTILTGLIVPDILYILVQPGCTVT